MSEHSKVTDEHRRRRAIVYVRQSTLAQVEHNHESRARQYALRDRAITLGWPVHAVAVVDDDLGRSGSTTQGRAGFRELVAEVGLGQVGIVLALEVSRFARRSSDWHQLLDLCALTSTLIADEDGIYSPSEFNDRLLLGMKGTMSEAELHLIRARLEGGLRNKAERGELALVLPVGLERDEHGRVDLTADEQVRHAIGRVFELWRRCGSARQVSRELVAEEQMLPRRTPGARRVRWQRASYAAVHDFLTNPAYAGAFAFGRTRAETTISPDGEITQRRRTVPLEQWSVLIREHHPGYVTWDSYLDTQRRLQANLRTRGEGGGAAREGKALLQGIIRCGRCGRRMQIAYSGTGGKILRYACARGRDFHATDEVCQSLAGRRLDRAVADAFLEAVTPAALRAGGEAVAALEREHEQRRRSQQLAVERAEQDAVRAQRQFDACEPENRLVGRTLEQRLETALATLERERSKLAEVEQRRPQALSDHERTNLAQLARELPRLWDAPSTSDRQRKELLRTIIGEVIVTVHEQPRRADAEIRWEGGARSHLTVTLTRRGAQPTRTAEDTVELIRRLAEHHPDPQIALILNRQGRRTGTGLRFTASRVAHVRGKEKIPPAPPPASDNELHTVEQAARELGVSQGTIYRWLRSGLLGGEQLTPGAPWRIRISDEVRSRFVPDIPDGYVPLDEAAKRLGIARQTVLHKVQRGELHAVQVTSGQRKGLRIAAPTAELGLLDNQQQQKGAL